MVGLQVTPRQSCAEGKVRAVQKIPSVEEAATDEMPDETAAKIPVFGLTVTPYHSWLEGNVRGVHVIPSVDEEAIAEL